MDNENPIINIKNNEEITPRKRSIKINAYDLSNGMVKLIPQLANIDAVWHTCLEIDETEYFFQSGIKRSKKFEIYGKPLKTFDLGFTEMSDEEVFLIIENLNSKYNEQTYHILDNNCNHFVDEIVKLMMGNEFGVPEEIMSVMDKARDNEMVKMFLGMKR